MLDDIELDDEDFEAAGGSTFSPATIILMVVLLGIGIAFGWVASNTLQNREVYNARSDDAARIHETLKPTVANVDETRKIVEGLSPEKPDFEATEKLAEIDLSVGGNVLGGNRLLLGPEIVDLVTSFLVDTAMLDEMIKEHHRLTTKSDREELEQLMEDNEVLEEDRFGVLFDYDHLAQRSGSEDYFPKMGRLVTVPEMETDDEGKLEVQLLDSDRTIKTRVQGLLPLGKGDILKTSGENALQRYQRRVARIQRHLMKYDQYQEAMMVQLEEMGSKEPAALLNF
jgi:hypothetical protein